jgi:amyloid beta A4 protein
MVHYTNLIFVSQSFSVRRQIYGPSGREGRNVYFTLAFAGVALMAAVFVGVAVAKYRASRSPHAQGFVEVDQVKFCAIESP